MSENTFNRSGLASLDDLSTPLWNSLFSYLESIQLEFIAAQPHCHDYVGLGILFITASGFGNTLTSSTICDFTAVPWEDALYHR